MITTVIIFLVVLGVLVFVHELGHFTFAKIAGMRVLEFGLGFPPRAWYLIKNGTRYSLNWLPIGGFVKILGEDGEDQIEDEKFLKLGTGKRFLEANRGWQALVLVAGISFNIIFAWLILSFGFMIGVPQSVQGNDSYVGHIDTVVTSVLPNTPAKSAGLEPGDIFISLELEGQKLEKVDQENIISFIQNSDGKVVDVKVKRSGEEKDVLVTPGLDDGIYRMGISLDDVGIVSESFFRSLGSGARSTYNMILFGFNGLWTLVSGVFHGHNVLSYVSGPVGIANMAKDAYSSGIGYLITFTAFISIELAILNVLPFPALDGGRLLFVGVEAITRKPIPKKIQFYANFIGFALLLTLMLVVTLHDVWKLL